MSASATQGGHNHDAPFVTKHGWWPGPHFQSAGSKVGFPKKPFPDYEFQTHFTQVLPGQISQNVRENTGSSGSATAEGPRDALCQLKSCQLLHSCTKQAIAIEISVILMNI